MSAVFGSMARSKLLLTDLDQRCAPLEALKSSILSVSATYRSPPLTAAENELPPPVSFWHQASDPPDVWKAQMAGGWFLAGD